LPLSDWLFFLSFRLQHLYINRKSKKSVLKGLSQEKDLTFDDMHQVSALASHWLEDCANFKSTLKENYQYSANHSYCNTFYQLHFLRYKIIGAPKKFKK
jgi:hypothetical protein